MTEARLKGEENQDLSLQLLCPLCLRRSNIKAKARIYGDLAWLHFGIREKAERGIATVMYNSCMHTYISVRSTYMTSHSFGGMRIRDTYGSTCTMRFAHVLASYE